MFNGGRRMIAVLIATILLSACASNEVRRVSDSERLDPVSTRLTGQQLRSFSKQVANELRTEEFFLRAVSDLRDRLGAPPNLEVASISNRTTQDDINIENVYLGFEEAFYATNTVAFTEDMPDPHLLLQVFLTEKRTYGNDGEVNADYTLRVRVRKIELSSNPDQPGAGYRVIGNVSEKLILAQDKAVLW